MILQGESYEFWYCLPDSRFFPVCNPETSSRVTLATLGTVFQTGFVALLAHCFCWFVALLDVACWMLLFGCCFLDVAFWMLLFGNIGNQPNNKITKQQDNKKIVYCNLHIGWSFHRSRVRLFMQSEVFP